jgi:hypothetical protein
MTCAFVCGESCATTSCPGNRPCQAERMGSKEDERRWLRVSVAADSGCTTLLLQIVNLLPRLKPFFSSHPLPVVLFTLPDGSSLSEGSPSHVTGSLPFPHKLDLVRATFSLRLTSVIPYSASLLSFVPLDTLFSLPPLVRFLILPLHLSLS